MTDDPEISSWLHDLFGDDDSADREKLERCTNTMDQFFENCEVNAALSGDTRGLTKAEKAEFLGADRYTVSEQESEQLDRIRFGDVRKRHASEWEQLRDEVRDRRDAACKSERMTDNEAIAGLEVLSRVLGKAAEHLRASRV